jgi:hypothetical protein
MGLRDLMQRINVANERGLARINIVAPSSSSRPPGRVVEPMPPDDFVDARDFSPDGLHAGTLADPWPGVAIKDAIDSLSSATGRVVVADGIWLFDAAALTVDQNNWTLEGQSLDAVLRFTGTGQLWFGSASGGTGGVSDAAWKNLTIDATGLDAQSNQAALRFSNAQVFSFTDNKLLGHSNGAVPAMFFEGGGNVEIMGNEFIAPSGGDSTLQIQSLGGTANSGFVVSENTWDSGELVVIGLNDVQVTNNHLHNATLGNSIGILVCGSFDGSVSNILVDSNIVDAGGANGAVISGLPNDPGGLSIIDDFRITNNTIIGTGASIHCQSFDGNNYLDNTLLGNEKTNVVITGNSLSSSFGGSGIDCRGGAGKVDTVEVAFNTLTNSDAIPSGISTDANTFNANIHDNTGV